MAKAEIRSCVKQIIHDHWLTFVIYWVYSFEFYMIGCSIVSFVNFIENDLMFFVFVMTEKEVLQWQKINSKWINRPSGKVQNWRYSYLSRMEKVLQLGDSRLQKHVERKSRLSLCNREKMNQMNVTRFPNSTQETSYNYSDTKLPFKKSEE